MPHDPDPTAPPKSAGLRFGGDVDRRPLYRVVEFMRDDRGRLREEGRIWHSDLHRVRQFGRAVADNTTGARVVIADNAGRVVEEVPLPGLAHTDQGCWEGWSERPLPVLPPQAPRPPLKRETRTTPASSWVLPAASPAAPARTAPAALPSALPIERHAPRPAPSPDDLPTLGEHDTLDRIAAP